MQSKKYYIEIENYIRINEFNKRRRTLEENYDTLNNYWNIGRLIVEAQGGNLKSKYGDELLKNWSKEYTKHYGPGYSYANMARYRQFYISFPIFATTWRISWSIIKVILPISDINKRNYYLNLCIEKNLTVRKLQDEIKSNSYERLIVKPEHIELIVHKEEYSILDDMKNPIIIKVDDNKNISSEKDLEMILLSEIEFILTQFGKGFSFIGSQYKIKNYYIDLLLFKYELNSFIVVELKIRKLKVEDKAQVESYMRLVDENLKKAFHNKTIGIIISKEQDNYVANFVRSDNLIPLEYKIDNNFFKAK